MKYTELERKKFYTDGETVYFKSKNNKGLVIFVTDEEDVIGSTIGFLKSGVQAITYGGWRCPPVEELNLRKVEAGEKLLNGEIEIIDDKNIKIKKVKKLNAKYDEKGYCLNGKEVDYETSMVEVNIEKYKNY